MKNLQSAFMVDIVKMRSSMQICLFDLQYSLDIETMKANIIPINDACTPNSVLAFHFLQNQWQRTD